MKIIAAGGSNSTNLYEDHVKEFGLIKLYSMLNERTLIDRWDDNYPLVVDSGAHTWNKHSITKVGMKGKSKLKPARDFYKFYEEYITKNKHKKFVFIELDTYGDLSKEEIDDYYYRISSMEDMTAKFVRVYHPVLDGGNLDTIRKWMDEGQDYIFIANDSLHLLDDIFYLTQDKIKVHGLAMTKPKLMQKYPFFSVDSTSPLATVIFGRYSRPIMSMDERKDIIDRSSIKCFDDDYNRLRKAVIEVKETEDLMTDLWTKKGVTWPELKF